MALGTASYMALTTATTLTFSRVQPGVADPSAVFRVAARRRAQGFDMSELSFSRPELEVLQSAVPGTLAQIAGYGTFDVAARTNQGMRVLRIAAVSSGFFDLLGVRGYGRLECAPSCTEHGIVLTARTASALGTPASAAVGGVIRLNGTPWTVQGVTATFAGFVNEPVDGFVALNEIAGLGVAGDWLTERSKWIQVVARVVRWRDLVTASTNIRDAIRSEPVDFDPMSVRLEALNIELGSMRDRRATLLLLAESASVALLVLLLSNVAQLFLIRQLANSDTLAIQIALGASHARLAVEALVQAAVPMLCGTLSGLVGGWLLASSIIVPRLGIPHDQLAGHGDLLVMSLPVIAGILAAALPVCFASLRSDARVMVDASRHGSRRLSRLSELLLAVQVAFAAVTLVVTVSSTATVIRAVRDGVGYDAHHLYSVSSVLRMAKPNGEVMRRLAAQLQRANTGMEVSLVNSVPTKTFVTSLIYVRSASHPITQFNAEIHGVDDKFFDVTRVGTRVLEPVHGQWRSGEQVIVLSDSAFKLVTGSVRGAGACISVSGPDTPCQRVVAVAQAANFRGASNSNAVAVYRPLDSLQDRTLSVLVRSTLPAGQALDVIRGMVRDALGDGDALEVSSVQSGIDAQIAPWRDGLLLLVWFSALGTVVAAVGVGGLAFRVAAQRRRHMALALALGASQLRVFGIALSRLAVLSLIAVVAGTTIGAVALEKLVPHTSGGDGIGGLAFVISALIGCISIGVGMMPSLLTVSRVSPAEVLKNAG
ncbi:MAG TPA: FtsX-like permease family protein [Gemmatimonadaceae bacterium]|nr:FtsX-like permease family protein [Gemmatimonadaceae bacterium]